MNILPILIVLQWQVYFSPNGGAQGAIIRSIDSAKTQILVQAYNLTSRPIAHALIQAKKRGLNVRVLIENSTASEDSSKFKILKDNKIDIKLDKKMHLLITKL